ncbi:hypothetical protein EF910_07650 [Streptomyces sp. WAC07149]|uniref:hypothetical protein n=1 Tax=Streptomyces sp. WAC07149 TaxID=2487425 RepID=UPI000F79CA34|nr:hypothetical protein [Streptomyces sp. WAC07149]RST06855.1 hypothetical protein EF910_07650 [Streptomyces sp. WAC07149]
MPDVLAAIFDEAVVVEQGRAARGELPVVTGARLERQGGVQEHVVFVQTFHGAVGCDGRS